MINDKRIENGIQAHPRANVKVIWKIIQIVLDLWRRRCEFVIGKTKKAIIKKKLDQFTKKIETLREKTNITMGSGRLHFEDPPREGTALS